MPHYKVKQFKTRTGRTLNGTTKIHYSENETELKKLFELPDLYNITPLLERPHAQQISVTLHYLCTGLLAAASKDSSTIGDLMMIGEDSIISELFSYAEAIEDHYLHGLTQDQCDSFPGVYQYELVQDRLGPAMYEAIMQRGDLPSLLVWRQMLEITIEQWIKGL